MSTASAANSEQNATLENMASELYNKLLEKQDHCFENIKRIVTNYKSDASSRKTMDYLTNRLDSLEAHWQEFQSNHEVLLKNEKRDDKYFEQNTYERTKKMYEELKWNIMNRKLELLTKAVSGSTKPTQEPPEQPSHHAEINSETLSPQLKTLVRQQLLNFNAFYKLSSKIQLDEMSEKWELEDNLHMLKSKWEAIDKIHWEIEFELTGANLDKYRQEYLENEAKYDEIKKALNKKIWSTAHYDKTTPKMQLPEFSGNYNQWISFRDLFTETINNNPLLSKAQKMQHLKTKLKGEAEKLIQHLTISAENYDSAWKIIEHRYENKRLLFSSYVNTLLNLPTIQQPSAQNIKKLHDTLLECLNGLHNLGLSIETWDPILVHLLLPKLDSATYADYIHDLESPRELPELQEFLDFLEAKFMAFETMKQNQSPQKSIAPQQNQRINFKSNDLKSMNYNKPEKWTKSYYTTMKNCPLCKKGHVLMRCNTFLNMTIRNRHETVAKLQICPNCLFSHGSQQCTSSKKCKLCENSHHTLLHDDLHNNNDFISSTATKSTTSKTSNHVNFDDQEVLLTTVQLKVKNYEGNYVTLRALLDQGSQVTLVTENAAQRLRLARRKMNAIVSGVGTSLGNCKGLLTLECKSIHSEFAFETEALIMKKLVNNLPNSTLKTSKWDYLQNLKLADPDFYIPGPIDILLGAEIYSKIIDEGIVRRDHNSPVAQHTKLGWILSGGVKTFNCLVTLSDLENSITKFWETEEVSLQDNITNSENFCEKHYAETTERMSTGQYIVQMPLKSNIEEKLGKTRPQAVSQFLQLEPKMAKQERFAQLYKQFIQEYIQLGHMKPAANSANNKLEAFLPHHGILREGSTTTKLRVVFNASMPTSTKYSLNDLMEKGPNLQKDILALILTWRTYKYALMADIEKMFRAIFLNKNQQNLQKIIWRFSQADPLQEWQLCTVTYGTKAAPFLAMRTLQQLAIDEGHAYPLAAKALRSQFYMDDVITGHNTIEEAKALQNELYCLLRRGGFVLHKWASNEPSILQDLTEQQKSHENVFTFKQAESTKTLGLSWNTKEDVFCFNLELPVQKKETYTKRLLLSEISKIYDPLGWISPVTIKAKLLFQNIWTTNLEWDDPVPENIAKEWQTIRDDLKNLKSIKIPRWIQAISLRAIELHGFCDASEKAYACVVFSRTLDNNGRYVITLLAAKTKVAPIKVKTTLPRLELCGALLLAKLIEKMKTAFFEHELQFNCWTDSQVVLAWLQGSKTKWERYITNRTTQINNIVPAAHWHHVKTKENSADCATRGLLPTQLLTYNLWWEGPNWLKTWKEEQHKQTNFVTINGRILECHTIKTQQTKGDHDIAQQLIERCSTITRVIRTLAWVLRFKTSLRNKIKSAEPNLTLKELDDATTFLINSVQQESFYKEIESLKKTGTVPTKSKILNLTPFLDLNGTLRVGGRLQLSPLEQNEKHPAIVPHDVRFTKLVIEHAHKQTLHGGARITLTQTRQLYWIIGGNRAVKAVIHTCVRCHRFKPTTSEQIMGNLPAMRVTPSRPFTHTGVDYTGHVDVKLNRGRGVKTTRGYIAIFICMATKAVHIELVSDLSSQAFIAALKRLCARRGTPKHLYSDNGTNFKGAANILQEEFEKYETFTSSEFFNAVNELRIEWHFIAPRWPTAGGLWEAAVKSMKHHLMRVMGDQKLDFEQLITLLTLIEACMNSRPLCPLSEDPEDLNCLTPGHFLTGSAMMTLPQENQTEGKLDLRNRWRMVETMHQHIWNRWAKEYLHQLQTKSKWLQPKPNLEEGDLVLVKEDNIPPGKWAMGRILELHPGNDGKVRVVTLKTQGSTLKRPTTKLSPLPINTRKPLQSPEASSNTATPPVIRSARAGAHNKLSAYITMLLLTLFTLSTTWAQPVSNFKLTPLEGNRLIYFDEIGDLQIIHDKWTLLIYYNTTTYWQSTAKITKYISNLDDLCTRMENQPCVPVISQLKHELQQLQDYNELLLRPHLSRKKRGYINGIGSLARTLFGTLDEEFAEKYQQDIRKIQINENYLLDLIKNQTSIIETENHIIKNNDRFMNQQMESIHEFIHRTNDSMTKITYKVEIMATMNDFNAASLTASLILNNLKRTQDMLLNTLTNLYNGHLDVHLITPKQLIYQLNIISAKISKELSLPIRDNNIENNIRDIYKLLYVRARITSSFLLLEVHIPLTSDDEYKIYRPIALPMNTTNQRYTSVTLRSSYIAVYLKNNAYLTLQDYDLDHCTQVNKGHYVCNTNYPVTSLRSNNAPCEAQVFLPQTSLRCESKTQSCTDKWIKLNKPNKWLQMCCEACQARILCEGNQISTAKLANIGILELNEGCVLQNKDTTVIAYNNFGNKLNLAIDTPQITDNLQINEHIPYNLSYIELKPPTDMEDNYRAIETRLKQLKDSEKLPSNLSSHDIHQFSVLYFVVGGLLLAFICLLVRRYRKRLNKNTKTQSPAQHPERHETSTDIELQPQQQDVEKRRRADCDACPQPNRKHPERRFSFGSY